MVKRPTTAIVIVTTLALIGCNQTPPLDRHVLWTGTGIPMSGSRVISSHESKAACEAARDTYAQSIRPGGHSTGHPDKGGAVWVVRDGAPHGVVCYPVGVNPG